MADRDPGWIYAGERPTPRRARTAGVPTHTPYDSAYDAVHCREQRPPLDCHRLPLTVAVPGSAQADARQISRRGDMTVPGRPSQLPENSLCQPFGPPAL